MVKSRKVERAVGVGRMKRVFAWDEGVSGRIQGRELREGITGGEEENVPVPEAQRRPFFTARTSVSGPRSPRNTNKNGELGVKRRGRDGQGAREIRSERGKWERRKSSAERQRGAARRKKDDRLDDTTVVPVVHLGFPFSSFFFSSLLFSAVPFSILASASVLHV